MRVFAYRNLHYLGVIWSLKSIDTQRVVARVKTAYFSNVSLKVSKAGRNRVLKERRKNVHAGVAGTLLKGSPKKAKWLKAHYNPYLYETFVDEQGNPVYNVRYAKLTRLGLFISF